jgi:hypothetical protein
MSLKGLEILFLPYVQVLGNCSEHLNLSYKVTFIPTIRMVFLTFNETF